MQQTYLGDGLYAEYDGLVLRLYTSNGFATTSEVWLEKEICHNLVTFISTFPPEPAMETNP